MTDESFTDLEDVQLTLYREDGQELQVEAARARYDAEAREGNLSGAVVVRGEDGLELRAEQLLLSDGGRLLTSEGEVLFAMGRGGRLTGRADRLRFDFRREMYGLAGNVVMRVADDPRGLSLEAGRVIFERSPQRLLRAEIGVRLISREGELFARRMAIYLAADRDAVEFVRARWQVTGRFTTVDPASGLRRDLGIEALGLSLVVDPATEQIRKLELEGSWLERAALRSQAADGVVTSAKARYLQGDFAEGRLVEVLALGLVDIVETAGADPLAIRRACGGRASVQLGADGTIARFTVDEQVDLHEQGLQASGEHLESQGAGGETVLTGKPAILLTKKGELRAPEIRLRRGGELLEALGDVDARVPRGDLAWVGPAEAWIQIRAARAQWQRTGSTWSFDGGVRAWSGSDVLTADQLRGDTAGSSLIASGNVQTVARLVRDGGGPPQPLKVSSDNLEYKPDTSRALYRGHVVATEPGRVIEANELEVVMDAGGEAETVWLRGAVSLVEQAGRKVTAEQAEYATKVGRITFDGQPVVVEDGKGGRLAGRRVEYDTKSGQVRVGGGQTDG